MDYKNSPEFNPPRKAGLFNIKELTRGSSSSTVKEAGPGMESQEPEGPKEYDVSDALINKYLSKLGIESIGNGDIISISFTGYHPETLAELCNMHAKKFIETNLELRFSASQDAVKWLHDQLADKKLKVEQAEESLLLYKEKQHIVGLGETAGIIEQKLEGLKSNLTSTRIERIQLKTLSDQITQYSKDPALTKLIPELVEGGPIDNLKVKYADLQAEKAMLSKKYGEKHPNITNINLQLKEVENRIKLETLNLITKVETDYNVLLASEESYKKAYEEQSLVAHDLNRKKTVYRRLQREAESERALYDILLQRMKESDIAGDLNRSSVSVLSPAMAPRTPIGASRNSQIMKGVFAGLALGFGLAFFLDYLDNTIKSVEDVEDYLGATLLGLVEKARVLKDHGENDIELLASKDPKSVFTESIRNIRTSIILSTTDSPHKVVLVTSTRQGEGKSFIASNLAITFAQTGKKTLLIDTDFRRPRQHKIFGMDQKPGLTNHFIGEIDFESILRPSDIPNLNIITSGLIPPNPSELLGSHSMEKFCDTVRDRFDMVIFDAPPTMTVTDSVVLSRIVDGVVFVIRSGQTPKELTRRALLQYKNSKCDVLGMILNLVDTSRGSYYSYYYSHYYKYGYGGESPKEQRKREKRERKDRKV
jgi:capsular exopolysaccharide synthesis family protein